MSAQPCMPQDIIEVNRNKEYTLISTNLLESVLTDARLNAQTTKLWQILFNYARFNPSFEIKISYSFLAKKLGKSERTIARYVEILQNTGYLTVKHNFDRNGAQRPSTLSVRVPEKTIEDTKKKQDRRNKNSSNNNITSINENNVESYQPQSTHNTDSVEVAERVLSSNRNVLCGTVPDKNPNPSIDLSLVKSEVVMTSQDNMNENASPGHLDLDVKNDRGGHDINVIQIENNKKDIHKNNNNIVVIIEENEKAIILQNEITLLERQLEDGNKQQENIKDHSLLYEQIRKNSQIEASLHLAKLALERLRKNIIDDSKQQKTHSELSNNPNFIQEKGGDRAVPIFTFKRLIKTLKSYGYDGNALNKLTNEIVFEARFGTLINCNKTNKPLSLDKAINIALKLVREKRWSTPSLMNQ